MSQHKIAYDHINENPDQPELSSNKIVADVYLDNRGICFRGRWDEWLIREILDFRPWQEQEKKRMENLANFKDEEDDIWTRGKEKRIKLCNSCC